VPLRGAGTRVRHHFPRRPQEAAAEFLLLSSFSSEREMPAFSPRLRVLFPIAKPGSLSRSLIFSLSLGKARSPPMLP